MSEKMFQLSSADYAARFAKDGYVHIRGGVTKSFFAKVVAQVEQSMKTRLMKEFGIGDKQQAMYEFPDDDGDYVNERSTRRTERPKSRRSAGSRGGA